MITSTRLVGAAVAALVLAGCSVASPMTALSPYEASDGLHVSVGDVDALNLLLVTEAMGEPALLTGSIVNSGDAEAIVGIVGSDGSTIELTVAAGAAVRLGIGEGDTTLVIAGTVAPGGIDDIGISVDGSEPVVTGIPVVDGTLDQYASVLTALGAYVAALTPAEPVAEPTSSPAVSASPSAPA